jgi:hypothetical protein
MLMIELHVIEAPLQVKTQIMAARSADFPNFFKFQTTGAALACRGHGLPWRGSGRLPVVLSSA